MAAYRDVERIGDAGIALGAGVVALAPLVLLVELAEWALTGQWPGWSIEDGLLFFGAEKPLAFFDATQFALDLLVNVPLALGIYLVGQILFWAALRLDDA